MWDKIRETWRQPGPWHADAGRAALLAVALFFWGAIESTQTLEHAIIGQRVPGVVTDVTMHHTNRTAEAAAASMSYVQYKTVAFEYEHDGVLRTERNDYPPSATYKVGDTIEVSYLSGREYQARIIGEPKPPAVYVFLSFMGIGLVMIVYLVATSLFEPDYVRNSRYRAWQRKVGRRTMES